MIVEALYEGSIAGTITSTIFQRIADCIEKGFEYVAQVVEVQGGEAARANSIAVAIGCVQKATVVIET